MPKTLKFLFLLVACAMAVYSGLKISDLSGGQAGSDLELVFFDVGQGDSVYIKTPEGKNILVDGGPGRQALSALARYMAWWDKEIDLLVLTHPHDDHVGGLTDILNNYQVGQVLYTGVVHNSPSYLEFLNELKESRAELILARPGQLIRLGKDASLEILYPVRDLAGTEAVNLNNTSIVLKLAYGQTQALLTGDIELEAEKELLEKEADLKAQILKVAHHGSNTSSHSEFLEAVDPQYAVISVGQENKFNHPSRRIERRLEYGGIKILRTDQEGDIVFSSDGKSWTQPSESRLF